MFGISLILPSGHEASWEHTIHHSFTIHWVKELLYDELEELFLEPTLVDPLLPLEVHPQLFPKVDGIQV